MVLQHGIQTYARGGLEQHIPQISAPGSPFRIWAEPETQGEAYIPLANDSRRGRAKHIVSQLVNEFGMQPGQSYADGGITIPTGGSTGGSAGRTTNNYNLILNGVQQDPVDVVEQFRRMEMLAGIQTGN
jgi:hypothetical protein